MKYKYRCDKMIQLRNDKMMIDEDKLDGHEAYLFVKYYLIPECRRHIKLRDEGITNSYEEMALVLKTVWTISAQRHQEDVLFTLSGIHKLIEKYDLKINTVELTNEARWKWPSLTKRLY